MRVWELKLPKADLVEKIVAAHLKGQVSTDLPFWKIIIQRKVKIWELKTPKPESQNKSCMLIWKGQIYSAGSKGTDMSRQFISTIKIMRSMATSHCRDRRCKNFKSWGRAAIKTTVLTKGHMVAHGELQAEKQFGSKPLLVAPTIA
jgi:hypothetical protein